MNGRRMGMLGVAIVSLLVGLSADSSRGNATLFFLISYVLAAILIVSAFWSWINLRQTKLSRQTRTRRTQVGRPLEERFSVRNEGWVPKLWLEVRDHSTLPNHFASHVVSNLGGKKTDSWRITTICSERGRYRLGPLSLRTGDPFGLFPREQALTPTANVVVYPMTVPLHQFVLPIGLLPGGDALRRRTHYVTTNAAGVRDYVPGDSFSRIHWASSARRDRLIVKEFELDPLADIWIVPDMSIYDQAMGAEANKKVEAHLSWLKYEEYQLPPRTEEYVVTVASSLAQYFLRQDRAVGVLAYGQSNEILQPDRGERQLNRILETMAVLRAEGNIPVHDVLRAEAQLLARGTTIIVVSCAANEAWASAAQQLIRRGLRLVTVLINPESFDSNARSVKALGALLQAGGVSTYIINNGDDLSAVLSQSLRRR